MPNTCPVCGSERKLIPAGVSKKTGRSYNSFWSCPNNCKDNSPRANYPQQELTREPVNQGPVKTGPDLKDIAIARESALKDVADIMGDRTDLDVAVREMLAAAETLVKYIYAPYPLVGITPQDSDFPAPMQDYPTEDVDTDDLPF